MKLFNLALIVAVVLLAVLTGLAVLHPASDQVPMAIDADRDHYSPAMSSTVGIGLTPDYPPYVDNRTVIFRWQADYGHFISWDTPAFKVENLGNTVYKDDGKIYWSYLSEDEKIARPPVHIALTMINRTSGAVLGDASLEIGWDDYNSAVVKA